MKRSVIAGASLLTIAVLLITGGWRLILSHQKPPAILTPQEQLDKKLITAIHQMDSSRVSALLDEGANPNARGYWDEARHERVWEPRLNTGGPTALILSAFTGNLKTTRVLLAHGADVNGVDGGQNTALMYAGLYGQTKIAHFLLDHRANTRPNIEGLDPLWYAISGTDTHLVRRLIVKGSKVNGRNAQGSTPILQSAGIADAHMIRELLRDGSNINAQDRNGNTALILVVKAHGGAERVGEMIVDRVSVSPADQIDSVEALLNKGADVSLRDENGRTALSIATECSLDQIVIMLRKAGAKE